MKKISVLLIVLLFLGVYSCGNSGKESSKTSEELVKESNACDEFLAHYEEWIDDYIKVIDSYFENPGDEANAARYMELMQEAMEWSTKWISLVDCADDEEYEKRFEKISNELAEKISELGL